MEGHVTADEGKEEDTEGPHCGRLAMVSPVQQPLRGRVDPGTWTTLNLNYGFRREILYFNNWNWMISDVSFLLRLENYTLFLLGENFQPTLMATILKV